LAWLHLRKKASGQDLRKRLQHPVQPAAVHATSQASADLGFAAAMTGLVEQGTGETCNARFHLTVSAALAAIDSGGRRLILMGARRAVTYRTDYGLARVRGRGQHSGLCHCLCICPC